MKTSTNPSFSSRRHQRGVGLIEVLIAVLVVSIGFLGVAALQAYSLSTNNSAMARSLATVASYSIFDAMRVDRDHALSAALPYNTTVKAGSCPATGTSLASKQLNEWCVQLGHDLGADGTTKGEIVCDAATSVCTVTITFDDSRAGGDDAQQVITRAAI